MVYIAQDSLADLYFTFTWESSHATHIENYMAIDVSYTRDILPLGIKSRTRGLGEGDSVVMKMDSSEVPPFKPGKVLDMPIARFQAPLINGRYIKPRIGRFYPKHFIESVPGTRPDSDTPFRVVDWDRSGFKADLNHPMAGREVTIKAAVAKIKKHHGAAGRLKRWPDSILKGPGMQARLPETPTDFLGAEPFKRDDESSDANFYSKPRMVHHMDSRARQSVQHAYANVLAGGMDILDLMAGHESHLPEGIKPKSVTGLGMNKKELEPNTSLTNHLIHDLNEEPVMPFESNSFDAVICTASVEYLIKPHAVFEEVARILRPGGIFAVAFSNRWFPSKVIRVWTELHEFERMGLVSQYMIRSEQFEAITTLSERGWERPKDSDDRYAEELPESDPVYAVWSRKKRD